MNDTTTRCELAVPGATAGWSVAGRFVEALARRDLTQHGLCLDDHTRLRALIPPGPVEVAGGREVAARFAAWFGGDDAFEVVDATVGEVGRRLYLRWRVRMTPINGGEPRLVEQHAFVTASAQITAIDLLCSGFVADASASTQRAARTHQPEETPCPST